MTQQARPSAVDRLRRYLATVQKGQLQDTGDLEPLLAACWHEFTGDYGGMTSEKLLGRMEDVTWEPPCLSFVIERHGGTAFGTSRAELQRWEVNVEQKTVTCAKVGHRQVRPMQARLNVEPLAEEVVALILGRHEDDRIKWGKDGSVRVLVGKIIPSDSTVKQTLAGRRKRFRAALARRMTAQGWTEIGLHTWQRSPAADQASTLERHGQA